MVLIFSPHILAVRSSLLDKPQKGSARLNKDVQNDASAFLVVITTVPNSGFSQE